MTSFVDEKLSPEPEKINGTDLKDIFDTVVRIRASLDRRFEKHPERYISKQETDKIKKALRDNNIAAIYNWNKYEKYSPEILSQVVSQNAWLIGKMKTKDIKHLIAVFDACRTDIFLELAIDIMEDRVDVPLIFKREVEALYYGRCALEECRSKIESGRLHKKIVLICANRCLEGLINGIDVFRFLSEHFKAHSELKDQYKDLKFDHLAAQESLSFIEAVFQKEIIDREGGYPWENLFIDFGVPAFTLAWDNMAQSDLRCAFRIKKKLIPKFFRSNAPDLEQYKKIFLQFYTNKEWLRQELIQHCVLKINDTKVQEDLIEELKKIGVPPEADLDSNQDKEMESVKDFYDAIENNEINWWNHPNRDRYMKYLVAMLHKHKAKDRIINDLLKQYPDNEGVWELCFRYLEIKAKSYNSVWDVVLTFAEAYGNDYFKYGVVDVIQANPIQSEKVSCFLQEVNFELYQKIYGRT